MSKYLVTIEFRSEKVLNNELRSNDKKITIGVFYTRDEANTAGNIELKKLENRFALNKNWNRKKRFSNDGGCFGNPNDLISNLGYINTPFNFYAKIEELKYNDIDITIDELLKELSKVKEFKNNKY